MAAYCQKCGASDQDAQLFALVTGDEFIDKQNSARQSGLGNLAKASAAAILADNVLSSSRRDDRFSLPNQILSGDDLETAVQIVRAAAMCSIAVQAYALNEDDSLEVSEMFA